MNIAAPTSTNFEADKLPSQSGPRVPHFHRQVPRFDPEELEPFPQNPREVQEDQLIFLTTLLAGESQGHNETRTRVQRYLAQALKNERELCVANGRVRYLNNTIQQLSDHLNTEKLRRMAAEAEVQTVMLGKELDEELENDLDFVSCWYPENATLLTLARNIRLWNRLQATCLSCSEAVLIPVSPAIASESTQWSG